MGGNLQKGKSNPNPSNNKNNKPQVKLVPKSEDDFKHQAELGHFRWFYSPDFSSWEIYNLLSEEKKQNVRWIIFPLEKSYEIERSFVNKITYEEDNRLIVFNYLQKNHMYIENNDNSMGILGIVKRDHPNNIKHLENLSRFETFNILNYFDNECSSYEYNLLNNLGIVGYDKIFSFFQFNQQDKVVANFISTTFICNQKFSNFLFNDYQEYIKTNFSKYQTVPFTLDIIKNMLLFDFQKETVFVNYYLNKLNDKNFSEYIVNMFLESSYFNKQIIDFSTKCSKKNINYTTYYLCLISILVNMNKSKDLWDKKEIKTYFYIPKSENTLRKNFYENNHYFSPNLLITSKNKFNNIYLIDKNIKKKYDEIEIRIPQKYCEINYHPLFNNNEFDIGAFSLYDEQNIIFPMNSIFKCINVDSDKGRVILEFAYYLFWNPMLYLEKDNKKRYNICEDGFKYLTDEQRAQIYIARVRSKEAKFIGGLNNLRELEIFDDTEPKTDIKSILCYFNGYRKLNCLTIVGNNMMNKECAKLSDAMTFLKELRILNLSFNSLTDSNISKITFDFNNKIEVLNLKSNNISDTGMESFKNELLKLRNLKEINLYDNQFGDTGFKTLISVVKTLKNLRVLTIPNCGISKIGIKYFSECFDKESNFMENLECLNLVSNPFGDESENNLIKIFSNLKSLKKYNLGQTQMSRFSKHKIFVFLHKKNKEWTFNIEGGWYEISSINLKEKNLFRNVIKQNKIPLFFDKINIRWAKKNAKKYQNRLNFDFSKADFDDNDISNLNKFLEYFPNIKNLNLSFCPNITSNGFLILSDSIKNLMNLTKINLSSNCLSDEGLKNLFKFLDKESKIHYINLSWNNITNDGFIFLCKTISTNKLKIKSLNVSGNKINDEGFKAFIEEVKVGTFNYLNKINFSHNLFTDETMYLFFTFFRNFVNLYKIDFSYNNITDNGIINFSSIINDLIDTISFIDISHNKLSEALKCFFNELGIPFNVKY